MATTVYDIGDKPTCTVEFRNEAGALTNPGAVTGILRTPDGIETTLSAPTNTGTGVYAWALPTLTQAGPHVVRAKGTSGLIAAVEVAFTVQRSAFDTP